MCWYLNTSYARHCRIPVSLQAEPQRLASNILNEILRTVGLGYETELLFGSLFRYILTNLSQHIMQPTTEENWREGHRGGTTQREQQLCDFLAQAWDRRAYRPSGDSGSGPVTKWEPHTHYPLLRTTQGPTEQSWRLLKANFVLLCTWLYTLGREVFHRNWNVWERMYNCF